jgi:hypothetical protein
MERRMTLKALAMVGFTGLLGGTVFAGGQDTPPCCQKKEQPANKAKATPSTKMRCTLTGEVVDRCCCEQQDLLPTRWQGRGKVLL